MTTTTTQPAADATAPGMLALLELEQGQVPGEVEGEIVAARPDRPSPLEPGDAAPDAPLHLVDMGHGMQCPGGQRPQGQ